eukprot:COSAG02_NODE_88_length_38629_cov_457.967999_22_plen_165_part_00
MQMLVKETVKLVKRSIPPFSVTKLHVFALTARPILHVMHVDINRLPTQHFSRPTNVHTAGWPFPQNSISDHRASCGLNEGPQKLIRVYTAAGQEEDGGGGRRTEDGGGGRRTEDGGGGRRKKDGGGRRTEEEEGRRRKDGGGRLRVLRCTDRAAGTGSARGMLA